MTDTPEQSFLDAIEATGITPPSTIVADGLLHRFSSSGRRGDAAGWYIFHADGIAAGAFGCWRSGINENWCAKQPNELTAEQMEEHRRRLKEAIRKREQAEAEARAECRKKAAEMLEQAKPNGEHPYLKRKGVQAHGVLEAEGNLLVPVSDVAGTLHGLQRISADGKKLFLSGTAKKGNFHLIGEPGDVVVVAEGYATAATIRQATGLPVYIAFDAGNLKPVAEAVRRKLPDARILIAGDLDDPDDKGRLAGQEGAEAAAKAVAGQALISPTKTDWNDHAAAHGEESVAEAFKAAIEAPADEGAPAEAEIIRLSELDPIKYEQRRKDAAKELGIRATALDREVQRRRQATEEAEGAIDFADPERWPYRVEGAELLDELTAAASRHLVLPAGAAEAIALWVVHSHAHDSARISPILAVTSPTPECGKTTLLTLLGALVPRPLPASNITASALFRSVEKWAPTVLVDEADTFLRGSDDLRGILNSGHNRHNAWVIRTQGDDHEPRRFATWAPKAVALIGKLPETLASRSVPVELRRMGAGETVAPLRGDRLEHLEPLCRKAWRWAEDNGRDLRRHEPDMPTTLRGRAADNWRHLLAIADLAGGDWAKRARRAAEALSGRRSDQSAGVMLLEDIRAIFDEKGAKVLPSAEIVEALGEMEDRPWPEWKAGRPLTQRQLARLLEPFKIAPRKFRATGYSPGTRGYERGAFEDAFSRYLRETGFQSATAPQARDTAGFRPERSATPGESVADRKAENPRKTAGCGAVADRNAETWEQTI